MTRINDEELKRAVQVINEAIVAVREQGGDVIIYPQGRIEFAAKVYDPISIGYCIPLTRQEEGKP